MFHVMVEWLDDAKTRARFALPGREEWKVEHIDALMQVLGQIREEMAPAVPDEPPQEMHFLHAPRYQTALHEFSGGSLIQFRRRFDQYVNLRPCRLMPGIPSPLAGKKPGDVDFLVVRENTEGEYSSVGGRMFEGTEREIVFQESIFSRKGVDRILEYAFELAQKRASTHLTSATKSNGISITMPYWDERYRAMAARYPGVRTDQFHIDILVAHFVLRPERFDVVVGSNLFGDILSDLGPAVCGTIGIAPSGNINPERKHPSLFEPVHGSAPDIAGRGIANPIGQIWSAALMLDFLGYRDAHDAVIEAIEAVLDPGAHGPRTRDLGGTASTANRP